MTLESGKVYVAAARFVDKHLRVSERGENIWVRRCDSDKDRERTILQMKSRDVESFALAEFPVDAVDLMTADMLLDLGRDMLAGEVPNGC